MSLKQLLFIPLLFSSLFSLDVTVSILPQKGIISAIAKDKADITVMVAPGSSPATYAPKPKQLLALQKSALYFSVGVPFEKAWIKKFQSVNPRMPIIDSTEGITKVSDHHHEEEERGHEDEGKNPHVWLSPILLKVQATNVLNALKKADPKNGEFYQANYEVFIKKADETDRFIKRMLRETRGKSFIIFHPSLSYFAKEYGLVQVAIEKEGKEPSFQYLTRIVDHAKEHHIKTVFVSPQFSKKGAQFIAKQSGAKVGIINPLKPDVLANIKEIAQILKHESR